MKPHPLVMTIAGAAICGLLSCTFFSTMSMLDKTQASEAIGYGIIVGILGGFIGAFIGAIIGYRPTGIFGGAVIGLVATIALLVGSASMFGGGDSMKMLQANWRVVMAIFAPPLILTGVLTAWLKQVWR